MRLLLLIAFTVLPLLEIALLVKFGQWAGLWLTLALVVATAVVGAFVWHRQGIATLARIQRAILAGEAPIAPMIDGVMLAIAGALLVTPGLISDAIGLALLVPPIRAVVATWLVKALLRSGAVHVETYTAEFRDSEPRRERSPRESNGTGPIIEGEFERLDEHTIDPTRKRPK